MYPEEGSLPCVTKDEYMFVKDINRGLHWWFGDLKPKPLPGLQTDSSGDLLLTELQKPLAPDQILEPSRGGRQSEEPERVGSNMAQSGAGK